jgi:hypothetical protein
MPLFAISYAISLPTLLLATTDCHFVSVSRTIFGMLLLNKVVPFFSPLALCFHIIDNFKHASHVTLSLVKLLNRIAEVDGQHCDQQYAAQRHKDTFRIAAGPLTHFVPLVVLAALIHDVGHPGVPNSQLLAENHELCQTYGVKSIAERRLIHIALQMLQKYPDLQEECIYLPPEEHDCFHQLLYHSVLSIN